MNSEDETVPNPTVRRKRQENKNYAPVDPRLNELEKTDCSKKFQARQSKAYAMFARPRVQASLGERSSNMIEKANRKEHNRRGFAMRDNGKRNLPIYLTPSKSKDVGSPEARLELYSKRHRCKHNKAYNHLRLVVKGVPTYEPFCDHDKPSRYGTRKKRCPFCMSPNTCAQQFVELSEGDINCDCTRGYCTACKKSVFIDSEEKITMYDTCLEQTKGLVGPRVEETTLAPWATKKKYSTLPINQMFKPVSLVDAAIYEEATSKKTEGLIDPNKVYTPEEALATLSFAHSIEPKKKEDFDVSSLVGSIVNKFKATSSATKERIRVRNVKQQMFEMENETDYDSDDSTDSHGYYHSDAVADLLELGLPGFNRLLMDNDNESDNGTEQQMNTHMATSGPIDIFTKVDSVEVGLTTSTETIMNDNSEFGLENTNDTHNTTEINGQIDEITRVDSLEVGQTASTGTIMNNNGQDNNTQTNGTIGQRIKVIVYNIPRRKPDWTKPMGRNWLVRHIEQLDDEERKALILCFYDAVLVYYYLHLTPDAESGIATFGPLLKSRTTFSLDEMAEIYKDDSYQEYASVRTTQDLISKLEKLPVELLPQFNPLTSLYNLGTNFVNSILATIKNSFSKIREWTTHFFNKIKSIVTTSVAYGRLKGFLERIYFVFEHIIKYFSNNPLLLAPLATSIYKLLTKSRGDSTLHLYISIFSILCTSCADLKDSYFRSFPTTGSTGSFWNLLVSFFSFSKIESEAETQTEVSDFEDEDDFSDVRSDDVGTTKYLQRQAYERLSKSKEVQPQMNFFKNTFSYSKTQFSRFYKFILPFLDYLYIKPKYFSAFSNSIKIFITMTSAAKSFHFLVTHFTRFFPQFIVDAFVSSNTKDYLSVQLRNKDSPFRVAMDAAMALEVALIRGDTEHLMEVKAYAKARQNDLLDFLKKEGVAIDSEMTVFLTHLKNYIYSPGVAKPRDSEPFTILVSGEPGVGKSIISNPLMSVLIRVPKDMKDEDVPDYVDKHIWVRNPANETWEGYVGQPIIRYDDLGQFTQGVDFQEVIGLKTNATYYPGYASINPRDEATLGVKGLTAEPAIVFAGSNMNVLKTDTVTNMGAINRRWSVQFCVDYAPGYDEFMPRPPDNSHLRFYQVMPARRPDEDYAARCRQIEGSFDEVVETMQDIVYKEYLKYKEKQASLRKVMRAKYRRSDDERLVSLKAEGFGDIVEGIILRGQQLFQVAVSTGMMFLGASTTLGFIQDYLRLPKIFDFLKLAAFLASALTAFWVARAFIFPRKVVKESGETKDKKQKQALVIKAEAGDDRTLIDILSERNVVRVRRAGLDNLGLNAVFVESNIILLPEHFFIDHTGVGKYIPRDTLLAMECPVTKAVTEFAFDPNALEVLRNTKDQPIDAVLYQLPVGVTQRKTIVKHFSDASIDLKNRPIVMGKYTRHGIALHQGKVLQDNLLIRYPKGANRSDKYQVHNSFEYDIQTASGDCGSPIYVLDGSAIRGTIVGIHVAGDHTQHGDSGFGLIITRSTLESALQKFRVKADFFTQAEPEMGWNWKQATADDLEMSRLEGNITLNYLAPVKIVPPQNCKEIQQSPLFDKISPHITEPVMMRVRGRDLFLEGILKYKRQALPLSREHSEIILEHLKRQIYSMKTVSPRAKVSQFIAMNGTWQYPYISRLDYDTSAGFPFYGKKKADLCVVEGEDYLATETLQDNIDRIREQVARREVPVDPIFDSLKVERKKIKYDASGNRVYKTRLFSAGPMTTLILFKEYFSGFFSHMLQSRLKHYSAVGISKEVEFDRIANKHLAINDLHYSFDYESFDGVKDLQGNYYVVARLITDFFSDTEYTNHRETLLRWAMCSPHQFREFVVQITGCSSGVWMTELMQGTDNAINIRGEWLKLAPHPYKTMTHFDRYVVDTNYGDDLILTVAEFAEPFFSGEQIRAGLKERGVTITPADKISTMIVRKPIEEIEFLKCSFTKIEGKYYPKMELNSLLETINWIRVTSTSPPPEMACEDNCRDVLRGLFYHGKEVYQTYYEKILQLRPNYRLYQYRELYAEFKEKGMIADLSGVFTLGSHPEIEKSDYYERLERKNNQFVVDKVKPVEDEKIMNTERIVFVKAEMEAADVEPGQVAQERVGVELINQKSPSTTTIPMALSSKAEKINPETPFTLSMSLRRFTKFADVAIGATPAPGAVIQSWNVIEDLLVGSNTYPYVQFLRWKCKTIVIQIQVTGCQFSSGKDLLVWRPTMIDKSLVVGSPTLQEALLLQHVAINPTSNTTAMMKLSPVFFKEWLSLDQKNQYGQLLLIRQNPFGVGSGPATYGLKLLSSVEDADFILPAPLPPPTTSVRDKRRAVLETFRKGVVDEDEGYDVVAEMEIPENVDEDDLPIHVFAVGSGATSDTTPPHWGETYTSLQDMVKRQMPVKIVNVDLTSDDLGQPQLYIFNSKAGLTPSDMGRYLRKITLPFRVCKIPRRYVVTARVQSEGNSPCVIRGYVAYLPADMSTPTSAAEKSQLLGAFPISGGSSIATSLAYSYFDNDTFAEVEVPYTNPTTVALVNQVYDPTSAATSLVPVYDHLQLVIQFVVTGFGAEGVRVQLEVFEMAADEARVGVFTSMPLAKISGGLWPDSYPTARNVSPQAGILGGVVSRIGGALEDVVSDVLPDSVTGLAKDLMGSLLDVPNVSTAPEPLKLKKRGYYSNTTQVASLERLSASAGAMQPMAPGDIGTTRDEMNILDFARRRMLIATKTITVTTAAKTLLYGIPVAPFMMVDYTTAQTMMPMDFVTHGMNYWRGGVELEVEFICSNYDEFKAEMTFSPDTIVAPSYDAVSTQYYMSALVKGTNNRFRFKVPHFADMPWKLVWSGQELADDDLEKANTSDYCHGIFQVWLGSNISSPSTTPNTIYMNVYARAADDFMVAVPSMRNTSVLVGLTTTREHKKKAKA